VLLLLDDDQGPSVLEGRDTELSVTVEPQKYVEVQDVGATAKLVELADTPLDDSVPVVAVAFGGPW
tara:strand:+ start:28318 stop:28515 length:198 start_codon:yes stop_codon:yes gene_type:complete